MANLLPKDNLKALRASQQNNQLITILLVLIGASLLILTSVGAFIFVLKDSEKVSKEQLAENKALIAKNQTVRTEAKQLSKTLTKTNSILEERVNYSEILLEIARVLPKKTSL